MSLTLNSKIMGFLIDELGRTVSRTGKSPQEITMTLSTLHPEILFNFEDWDQLPYKTKDAIISRIKKTLESFA
ncbi:MAG: hypothetical protein H6Q74_2094 [Firmicutes bacterium]|nr:hypothetical protein [Bacillota bacterium]